METLEILAKTPNRETEKIIIHLQFYKRLEKKIPRTSRFTILGLDVKMCDTTELYAVRVDILQINIKPKRSVFKDYIPLTFLTVGKNPPT